MSKTFRRKRVPSWVVTDVDYSEGCRIEKRLEGKPLKKKLAWWHSDVLRHRFESGPNKAFRQEQANKERLFGASELHKFVRNNDYEVLIISRTPYPYWD